MDGDSKNKRSDVYVADISARLRHVCQHLTDAEFTSLVLDMAEMRLRFADIDRRAFRIGFHGATGGPADVP